MFHNNIHYDPYCIDSIYNVICILKNQKSIIKKSYILHPNTYTCLQIQNLNNRIKYLEDKMNNMN